MIRQVKVCRECTVNEEKAGSQKPFYCTQGHHAFKIYWALSGYVLSVLTGITDRTFQFNVYSCH